tara:strand:- start:27946 stop:28167 length:222 start_codon:yes stop_codon:yes gene_type:complete
MGLGFWKSIQVLASGFHPIPAGTIGHNNFKLPCRETQPANEHYSENCCPGASGLLPWPEAESASQLSFVADQL